MTQPSFVVRRLIVHLQWTLFTLLAFVVALLLVYYEDSRMTLLMKAPLIFDYSALTLAVLSLLLFIGLLLLASSVYQRLLKSQHR